MIVLGLNTGVAASHDGSACLVDGSGGILAFVEEERMSGVRHAPGQAPVRAIAECIAMAGLAIEDIDLVSVGWDEPRLAHRTGHDWLLSSEEAFLQDLGLVCGRRRPDLSFVSHHRAHAISALYASAFDEAAILVMDGNGEDESISIFHMARGGQPVRLRAWPRVCSLGYLYEAASRWLGLGGLNQGKTMGLAAYHRGADMLPAWITVEGSEILSALGADERLDYDEILPLWERKLSTYAGCRGPICTPARLDQDPVAVRVAWAAQRTVETALTDLARVARRLAATEQLCIAGGVGLNCSANGRLPGPVFVPPVPHDTGVALGAAWAVCPPAGRVCLSPYTGSPTRPGTLALSNNSRLPLEVDLVAELLAAGAIGAICRGRAEVGPRALCHRSILASPVVDEMRTRLNAVKRREPWRPFGPVVGGKGHGYWGDLGDLDRYMIGATSMTDAGRSALPAVCHVDGTTRPQCLRAGDEPFVAGLLEKLRAGGHPPVLVNTSLNGPGQPLVQDAAGALRFAEEACLTFLIVDDELILINDIQAR